MHHALPHNADADLTNTRLLLKPSSSLASQTTLRRIALTLTTVHTPRTAPFGGAEDVREGEEGNKEKKEKRLRKSNADALTHANASTHPDTHVMPEHAAAYDRFHGQPGPPV